MAMLFWGVIACVFGVVWLITLLGFISSRFYNSRVVRWIGFVPFAVTTLIPLYVVGMMYYSTLPPQVFRDTFGFAPTRDVRELQSQYWLFGDTGLTHLKFKANRQTIERIAKLGLEWHVAKREEGTGEETETGPSGYGSDTPEWWTPKWSQITHTYSKSNRTGAFREEQEDLYYDERTQQAYYSFIGID